LPLVLRIVFWPNFGIVLTRPLSDHDGLGSLFKQLTVPEAMCIFGHAAHACCYVRENTNLMKLGIE